VHLQRNWKLQ